MAKNNSLFPDKDPYGLGNSTQSLFPESRPMRAASSSLKDVDATLKSAYKAPTKKELQAQEEAAQMQFVNNIRGQLNAMREAPEWSGASLDRREEMLKTWRDKKFSGFIQQYQDPQLRMQLNKLIDETLGADIKTLKKSKDDSSWWSDTAIGTEANARRMESNVNDLLPASRYQMVYDDLKAILDEGREPTLIEKYITLGPAREIYDETGDWNATLAEVENRLGKHLADNKVTRDKVKEVESGYSIDMADKNIRAEEFKDESGAILGTLRNLGSGANLAREVITQSPSIVPTIAMARGGLVPLAGVGAGLSAQDALGTAFDQVMNMPQDQLDMSEPYREIVDSGVDPDTARQRLAARVSSGAIPLAAVMGAVAGPLGPEAAIAKALTRPAANTVATSTARAVTDGLIKTGVSSTMSAADNAATQLSANLAQQRGVGEDSVDTLFNVGEAGTLGFALGSTLGGPAHISTSVRANAAARAEGNTPAKEGTIDEVMDIPAAQEAAEATTETQASTIPEVAPVSQETIIQLQESVEALRSRAGTTMEMGELSPVLQQLYEAQEVGVPLDAITRGLDSVNNVRAMAPESGFATLVDAYNAYAETRAAEDTASMASDAAANMNNVTEETINGRTDERGTTEPVADSLESNSGVETTTTRNEPVTTESINNVIEDGGRVETEQVSGAERDATVESQSNAVDDATLGIIEPAGGAISRPDNQSDATGAAPIVTGERSSASTAGQRPADGGSAAGVSSVETGVNPVVEVGQTVSYRGNFPNAPTRTGTVETVNADGTFNLRTDSGLVGNLDVSGVVQDVPQSLGTIEPAQAGNIIEPPQATEQVEAAPAQAEPTAIEQATREKLGETTPEGRDAVRLDETAERLYDYKDGMYSPDAAELQGALARGDLATADQIASYLYSQGLRQFAPPNKATGAGRQLFVQQMEQLNSFDRSILRNEFDSLRDTLPPEVRDHDAFVNTVVQDALLVRNGGTPMSNIYNRLSKFARDVVNKIAKGIAAVALVLTLSNTFPINDAVAASGTSSVNAVTHTQGFSQTADVVNSWVTQTKDNAGQKYIIADKATGEIHIMDGKGNVLATAPALYGSKIGDGMTVGETPAGIFTLTQESAPSSYGGDLQHFADAPNGDIYAIHRVLTNNPKQNRLGRLASKTGDDNRISLGCINIPTAVYDQHLASGFQGKLYILPDQKDLNQVFKGIEEIQAKQDLREGSTLPDDIQDPTSDAFQSSTSVLAEPDAQASAPVDGTSLTTAAADMGMGIADTPMASLTTNPATTGWASAAMIPFFVAWRNRRRVENSGKLGDASNNTDGETPAEQGAVPTPDMGPNAVNGAMSHTVAATDRPTVSETPATTRDWVTDRVVNSVMKVSDSSRRFTDWTSQFVAEGRERDSHDINVDYKLAANRIRQMQQRMMEEHLTPMFETLRRVSTDMGRAIDVVGDHFGVWTTMQHIPEANAALRRKLQQRVNETMLSDPAEYATAYAELQAHDAYQATGQNKVPMAGGLTDAQARVIAQRIEGYGYNIEDLQAFQQRAVNSFQQLLNERVQAGVITQHQVETWNAENQFKNYVPLYVDKTNETGGDVFMGSAMYNPAGEHARNGSETPANHALVTMHQYISRSAAGIGSNAFKARLHNLYDQLHAQGDTRGLRRIAVNDKYLSSKDSEAVGLFYRDPVAREDENGNPQGRLYKYVWDDARIAKGILRSNSEQNLGVLRNMAAVTNAHARLITKYDPSFAPFNWVRDGWERATSLTSKELYNAQGERIGVGTAARKFYVGAMNPIHIAKIAANIANPNWFANSETIRGLNQLRELGGLTTYNNALAMNEKAMKKSLQRMKGLRRHAAMLDNFFTQWNEAFGAAPAVGAFLAGVEMGVPAREMAFRVLDTFNTNNRGEWTNVMQSMTPFVVPAVEGGRNMIRNLSSRRGRILFAGQVAMAAALYGAMRSFAPDDPEKGNALDAMSLTSMARFIPLFNKDGSYAKLPVSFGMSRLAWIMGAGSVRISNGTYEDMGKGIADVGGNLALAALQEVQPFDFAKDVYADNIASGIMLSAVPAITQPFVEIAFNKNHFGNRIHSNTPVGGFASDSAMAKTPDVWSDIAVTMQKTFGIDAYPESYRHLINGYALGPARAITTMMEADSNYTMGGRLRTRQELGPVWDAVGLARYWDNGITNTERQYYNNIDMYSDILRKYHVSDTDKDNKPGTKAISAYNRILEAGGTDSEAMIVYTTIVAEADRKKLNQRMKDAVKEYKSLDLDLETLSPMYEAHAQETDILMRDYIRNIRSIPR